MRKTFALVLLLSLSSAAFAQNTLFENGVTDWKIYIPEVPGKSTLYAAEELRDALKKASGADFQIVKNNVVPQSKAIVVGDLESSEAVKTLGDKLKLKQDEKEQLAVYTIGGNLYLAGNNRRGALYAVYSFLGDQLDIRWLWPGDDGEFIPKRSSYVLPQLAWNYVPVFKYREMTMCDHPYHLPTQIWLARNFLNSSAANPEICEKGAHYKIFGGHSVYIEGDKDFSEHPEYFAMISGKRSKSGSTGCWSNEGFFKMMVDRHIQRIKGWDIATVFPADVCSRCECPECTKNPDISSRWYNYYHKLITELKKTYPDMKFGGIAYQDYREIPKDGVKGLEYVEYCQYNRCYMHKLNDPDCTANQKSMVELKAWAAAAPTGIYGYEFDIYGNPGAYLPFWNMIADEMKVFRDMKLNRIKTEMVVNYIPNGKREEHIPMKHRVANYMYAHLMWNPDAKADDLLESFCRSAYGPAEKELLEYHKAMAKAWDSMKIHVVYFFNRPEGTAKHFITPELIKFAEERFRDGEKALDSLGDEALKKRYQGEIDLERALFGQWVKSYRISQENITTVNVLKLKGADPFEKAQQQQLKNRKGESIDASAKFYWSDDALHIRVNCVTDMSKLPKGQSGHDTGGVWLETEYIEIFVDPCDGQGYRHFMVNSSGGYFEGLGWNNKWNPEWKREIKFENDKWVADITLPFKVFGRVSSAGDQWIAVVDYTRFGEGPIQFGFPNPAYHDVSGGALLNFSASETQGKDVLWISKNKNDIQWYSGGLLEDGWNFITVEDTKVMDADLSSAKMIVIYSYNGNKIPQKFYAEKLVPAVKNGAVVFYNAAGTKLPLETYFNDAALKVKMDSKYLDPADQEVHITKSSFSNSPFDMKKIMPYNNEAVFIPEQPARWEALVTERIKDGSLQPVIMATPFGKGMIAVSAPVRGRRTPLNVAQLLSNILEYNKKFRSEK